MTKNARGTRQDTAGRLHALAIQLLRRVRKTDAVTGLSPARASAMSVLVFGGPRTIGELAAAEMVSAPTMTRLVAGLESDGYVVRSADPNDARAWQLRATAKGKRMLEAGRQRRIAQVTALLERLDEGELKTVGEAVAILERVLQA
jgi:DNA-binding MarR family transcriptional regulator